MDATSKLIVGYVPLAIFAGIMLWRLRTMNKARPLRPRTFWIPPLLVVVLVGWILMKMPTGPWGLAAFLAGLALGCAAGWQRARWMQLHIDGAGSAARVMVRQSPAALLLIMGIAGVRAVFRTASGSAQTDGYAPGGHLTAGAATFTDALLGFAVGMIVTHRIQIWRAAKALFESQRAS